MVLLLLREVRHAQIFEDQAADRHRLHLRGLDLTELLELVLFASEVDELLILALELQPLVLCDPVRDPDGRRVGHEREQIVVFADAHLNERSRLTGR